MEHKQPFTPPQLNDNCPPYWSHLILWKPDDERTILHALFKKRLFTGKINTNIGCSNSLSCYTQAKCTLGFWLHRDRCNRSGSDRNSYNTPGTSNKRALGGIRWSNRVQISTFYTKEDSNSDSAMCTEDRSADNLCNSGGANKMWSYSILAYLRCTMCSGGRGCSSRELNSCESTKSPNFIKTT
jgi:hypothetical protein